METRSFVDSTFFAIRIRAYNKRFLGTCAILLVLPFSGNCVTKFWKTLRFFRKRDLIQCTAGLVQKQWISSMRAAGRVPRQTCLSIGGGQGKPDLVAL